MGDIVKILRTVDNKISEIATRYKKLKRTAKAKISERTDFEIYADVQKPKIEIIIFTIEKELFTAGKNRVLVKKIIIRDNVATFFLDKDLSDEEVIQEGLDISEITGLGFQVEHAGIYGKKMELSISEYRDTVWKSIDTGDFIMVRSYLESDEIDIDFTLEDIVNGTMFKNKTLSDEETMTNIINVDFAGIITTKEKNVGSTEQFRIEAIDIVKIIQQLNISIAINNNDDGWVSSDFINIYFESFLHMLRTIEGGVTNIKDFSQLEDESNDKIFWSESTLDGLTQANKTKFRGKTFDKILVSQMLDNTDEPFQSSISILATPVAIVNMILQYVFFKMGLQQFFNIDIDLKFLSERYVTDSIYIDEVNNQSTPYTLFVAYLYNNNGILDIKKEVPKDEQILKFVKGFSINRYIPFAKIGQFKSETNINGDETHVKDYLFLPNIEEDSVKGIIDLYGYNRRRFRFDDPSFFEYVNAVSKIKFNNFFASMNGNNIAIRSSEFKAVGGIAGLSESIPLSSLLYLGYSAYNTTPVFDNVFKSVFHKEGIKAFNSYNYMYSLAQSTWFTSAFINDGDEFKFIIYPLITPSLYKNIPHYSEGLKSVALNKDALSLNKAMIMNTSDLLEFNFNQLKMNRKILYMFTDKETNLTTSGYQGDEENFDSNTLQFITLYEGVAIGRGKINENIKAMSLVVDPLTIQSINIDKINIETDSFIKPYIIDTITFHTTYNTYIKEQMPHLYHVYRTRSGSDEFREVTWGTPFFPQGSTPLVTSREIQNNIDTSDGAVYFSGSLDEAMLPHEMVLYGVDEENLNAEALSYFFRTFPLSFNYVREVKEYNCNFDRRWIRDVSDIDDFGITLPYNLSIKDEHTGAFTSVPYLLAGVKSVINTKTLEDSVEFLLYKDLLPKQLLDKIFMKIRKVNLSGDLATPSNSVSEVMDLSEVSNYLKAIISRMQLAYTGGNEYIPYEVYAYPNLSKIFDYFKTNFQTFTDNVLENDYSLNITGQNALSGNDARSKLNLSVFQFITSHLKNPLLLSPYATSLGDEIEHVAFAKELEGFTLVTEKIIDDDATFPYTTINNGIKEIIKILFSMEKFVQTILRSNYDNGSLYIPNQGLKKLVVGSYIYLVDDREYLHMSKYSKFDRGVFDFIAKKILRMDLIKAKLGMPSSIDFGKLTKFYSNIKNSIYVWSDKKSDMKPYGWFVWKTVTYMGDASGGGGGTSGYTQKIYLARDGVAFLGHFQEEDFITKLASSMSDRGYQVIVPEVFRV